MTHIGIAIHANSNVAVKCTILRSLVICRCKDRYYGHAMGVVDNNGPERGKRKTNFISGN